MAESRGRNTARPLRKEGPTAATKAGIASAKRALHALKAKSGDEPLKASDIVNVKNTGNKTVCTIGGVLKPGDEGKCTVAQRRSYNHTLEQI